MIFCQPIQTTHDIILLCVGFHFYRSVDIRQLSTKLTKPALAIVIDILKNTGFVEKSTSGTNHSNVLHLPQDVDSKVIENTLRKLMCILDEYYIIISDIVGIAKEIQNLHKQWIDIPAISSQSQQLNVILLMVQTCLQHLESPHYKKLRESLFDCYQTFKHKFGIICNTSLRENDSWKCWKCGKTDNLILSDIQCEECGDISINPYWIVNQTDSSKNNVELNHGIGLTMYQNLVK